MIFFKKEQETQKWRASLEDTLHNIASRLHSGLEQEHQKIEELNQMVKKIGSDIARHDMALEDMLESLDEKSESERFMSGRVMELNETEEKLLLLITDYQEQLFLIDSSIKNRNSVTDAWESQFALVREKLFLHMTACGITSVSEPFQTVNYDYHEVIKVVDTENEELNRTVAQVYSPGFIYKGKVFKKAKIAAYRLADHKIV